jgi:hypothetical protein
MNRLLPVLCASALLLACGGSSDNVDPDNDNSASNPTLKIDISGTFKTNSAGGGSPADYTGMTMVDPVAVLADPAHITPIATATVTVGASSVTFSAKQVLVGPLHRGLWARFEGHGGVPPTLVEVLSPARVNAARTTSANVTDATILVTNGWGGDLTAGFFVGVALKSDLSVGDSGLLVTSSNPLLKVTYPGQGQSTAQGIFFGAAPAGTTTPVLADWNASAGKLGQTYKTLKSYGTVPGHQFVMLWLGGT